MVNFVLVPLVVLTASMAILTCSAQPNFDKMCKHIYVLPGMTAACVPEGECGGSDGPGQVAMNCSKPGTVCCVTGTPTRPNINFDALCKDIYPEDPSVMVSCVKEKHCDTDGAHASIFECTTEGEVCCISGAPELIDFDEICSDVYVPAGTGLTVGCVNESMCITNGPLGPLFECNNEGQVCCMSDTAEGSMATTTINYDVVCGAVYVEEGEAVDCVEESQCISDQGGILFPCSNEGESCCMTGVPPEEINLNIICSELFVPEGVSVNCEAESACDDASEGTPLFRCSNDDEVCCMTGTPTRIQPGK